MVKRSVTFFVLFSVLFFSVAVPSFAQKTITFAAVNWEPYSGEKLPSFGFHSEITVEAMKRAGYNVQIKFVPWERGLLMVRTGEVDGILTIYYTEERAQTMLFSAPVTFATVVLMKRKDSIIQDSYQTLQDLRYYTFSVVRGFASSPEFDSADYLKKEFANSGESNLLKLQYGRVDMIAEAKENILYLINTDFPEIIGTVEVLDPPLNVQNVYNAFSKAIPNSQKLVEDFNKSLHELKDDGTYNMIMQKHGQYE